jgi:hypothetical protein
MNRVENFERLEKLGKYFLLIIVILCASLSMEAQLPTLKVSVDKNAILIGEQFSYKIEASFPIHTYNVQFPALPDSFNHFEVVKKGNVQTVESNGILNCSQVIKFTSFDSGQNTFPPLPMIFHPSQKNATIRLFTDSLLIHVNYSPLDSVKTFHDIKSIIEVKDEWPLWMWIALGLSIILLIILLYFLIRNSGRKKLKTVFTSKLSPIHEAQQLLKELESQQLLSKGEVKQFHTRLAEIFKRYISRKTNSNLLNLTTDEILINLSALSINKEIISITANNLRMADAVKFAKFIPGNHESNEAFFNTRTIIEKIDQLTINSSSDI